MYSKQEIFDKAYRGVVKQGIQAKDGLSCAYITDDDTMCAAGHVMSGEIDSESRLWNCVGDVKTLRNDADFFEEKLPWEPNHDNFVYKIQQAHDYALNGQLDKSNETFVRCFKKKMYDIAIRNGLEIPEV